MQEFCPYCGGTVFSKEANFCVHCGRQFRELSSEDAALVPPEAQRQISMPIIMKVVPGRPYYSSEEIKENANVISIFCPYIANIVNEPRIDVYFHRSSAIWFLFVPKERMNK